MRSISSFFSAEQVEHFKRPTRFPVRKNNRNEVNKIQPVTQTRRVLKGKELAEQAPMPDKRKVPPLLRLVRRAYTDNVKLSHFRNLFLRNC
ncbi:hypothetical protein TNCV_1355941 [Trichonephila clavipes]|uniref:Uncharacterized protein n=1 Tax=Trichonephila clavipes TaxID=2585209 RepID=A0A8X6SGU5_TRICX|nr:hypothetical protein TNCV_1355941 [Trichonephila clavipes]